MSVNKENLDNELLKKIDVIFLLRGDWFPDNKIYGTIEIKPKLAENYLEKLFFHLKGHSPIEFPTYYRQIAIAGFKQKENEYWAHISAKFRSRDVPIESIKQTFYFYDYVYTLSPSFEWRKHEEKDKSALIVQWKHIGNKKAHEYLLYLDKKKIMHIQYQEIADSFEVQIRNFEKEKEHEIQIVATLFNGKVTCRSDVVKINLSEKPDGSKNIKDILTIFQDNMPENLPICIPDKNPASKDKKIEKKQSSVIQSQSQTKRFKIFPCKLCPHDKFPGIEHYFEQNQSYLIELPMTKHQVIKPKNTHDDDDDVICSSEDT